MLFAKTKKSAQQHAPLSVNVIAAKSIFIENSSGQAAIADRVYGDLKAWGKYQVVTSRREAELILVVSVVSEQKGGTEPQYKTSYN